MSQDEPVVPIHVPEPPHPEMAVSAVKFHEHEVPLIGDIAAVRKTGT
jgi:hypothetical protein